MAVGEAVAGLVQRIAALAYIGTGLYLVGLLILDWLKKKRDKHETKDTNP